MFNLILYIILIFEILNTIYHYYMMIWVNMPKEYSNIIHKNKILDDKYLMNEFSDEELVEMIENLFNYDNDFTISFDSIKRDNMEEMISEIVYFKDNRDFRIKNIVDKIEERLVYTFESGYNTELKTVKYGRDRIQCNYQLGTINIIMFVIKIYTYSLMRYNGYKTFVSKNGIVYFIKKKTKNVSYIYHGLGLGVLPYVDNLDSLDTSLVFALMPNISNIENDMIRIFPEKHLWIEDINEINEKYEFEDINLIGHSFGTIICGYIIKSCMEINKIVLVEPVCFFDGFWKIIKYISNEKENILYDMYIYNDIYLKYILHRVINGDEYWLYLNEIEEVKKYLIILSEGDDIVHTEIIRKKCDIKGIDNIVLDNMEHSDIFVKYDGDIFEIINNFIV